LCDGDDRKEGEENALAVDDNLQRILPPGGTIVAVGFGENVEKLVDEDEPDEDVEEEEEVRQSQSQP
jgi:hypothetical protein